MHARIPLFPLNTPVVPGLVLPLHIFEPRYRELVRDLLDIPSEDAREFGIVAVRDGQDLSRDGADALYPIGVTTVLRQVEELPDGRFDIVTTGSRRFQLLELDDSAPLAHAEVAFLDEVTEPEDSVLAVSVARRFRDYRAALSGQVQATVEDDIPGDPTVLSYLVTAAMILPLDERQQLLAAASTADRLRQAGALLSRENLLISELAAVPALDLPGATPSPN